MGGRRAASTGWGGSLTAPRVQLIVTLPAVASPTRPAVFPHPGGHIMRCLAKLSIGVCALAALALVAGGYLAAGEKGTKVKVGDKAPAFDAKDEQGKTWKSADHVGKK